MKIKRVANDIWHALIRSLVEFLVSESCMVGMFFCLLTTEDILAIRINGYDMSCPRVKSLNSMERIMLASNWIGHCDGLTTGLQHYS